MTCRLSITHPDRPITLLDPLTIIVLLGLPTTTILLDPHIITVLLLQLGIHPHGVVWIVGISLIAELLDREVFKHF